MNSTPGDFAWDLTDAPSRHDAELIDQALEDFNHSAAPLQDVRPLSCFVRRTDGTIAGGVIARTWGECCEVQQIWVAEQFRGKSFGRRLMGMVEQEARNRGCSIVYLETFSFQSPEFYRRLGFVVACEFRGFPNGIAKHVMSKSLA